MATTVTYVVEGMTCEHCVRAVTTELGAIPGVQRVHVDLASGTAEVVSDAPLPFDAVRAAVDEAGYEVGIPA
jgi:copper ion binding protein